MKESLDFIYKEQKELSTLGGVSALLGWDQMTYMPTMGAAERSDQSALISKLAHERVVSDKLWNHIEKLSNNIENLSEKDKAIVTRLRKDVEKARKIPSSFVERMAKTTTFAYPAWQEAREKSDFSIFSPHLEKIVELEKEYCKYINLPGPGYNSLLDSYEEGMTVEQLIPAFSYLKTHLVEIFNKIRDSKRFRNQQNLKLKFDAEKQKEICYFIIKNMFISNAQTRFDVSTHPFTTRIGDNDVRFTTNYERPHPLFAFFSTLHEGGHALYDLSMPKDDYKDTVISDAASVGLHESQSRFWENMIGRSYYFWKYFYPVFQKSFSQQLDNINLDTWYFYINGVKPSTIRIEADELTYSLHVILRFEIELDLISGNIEVADLPAIWNEKMNELLGIIPSNDREGVLQDMHWSTGEFGYFPTYIIGTVYASQLFNTLSMKNPNVYGEIQNGNFKNIVRWLRECIHKYGRLMTADEIITQTCGEGLNPGIFVDYLKNKFFSIYEI